MMFKLNTVTTSKFRHFSVVLWCR